MASKRDLLKNKIKRHAEIGAKNNVDKSKEYIERIISNGELIEVDPSKVGIWEYANRSANEMGDMTELAESIKEFGQIQPAVIVPKSSSFMPKDDANNVEYVVIAGRRRREACLAYNIKYLACLHTNLDVETALEIQRVENSEREDISDFSEGMSYYQAIKDGKASHKKLFEKSNTSKAKVTMLLSFGNIKDSYPELFNEISDFSKVSSRVAYDILSHAKKGKEENRATVLAISRVLVLHV